MENNICLHLYSISSFSCIRVAAFFLFPSPSSLPLRCDLLRLLLATNTTKFYVLHPIKIINHKRCKNHFHVPCPKRFGKSSIFKKFFFIISNALCEQKQSWSNLDCSRHCICSSLNSAKSSTI